MQKPRLFFSELRSHFNSVLPCTERLWAFFILLICYQSCTIAFRVNSRRVYCSRRTGDSLGAAEHSVPTTPLPLWRGSYGWTCHSSIGARSYFTFQLFSWSFNAVEVRSPVCEQITHGSWNHPSKYEFFFEWYWTQKMSRRRGAEVCTCMSREAHKRCVPESWSAEKVCA